MSAGAPAMARSPPRIPARNGRPFFPCAHVCRQELAAGLAGSGDVDLFPTADCRREQRRKAGHFGVSSSTRTCRGEDDVAEHIFRRRARSLYGRTPRNGGRGIQCQIASRRPEEGVAGLGTMTEDRSPDIEDRTEGPPHPQPATSFGLKVNDAHTVSNRCVVGRSSGAHAGAFGDVPGDAVRGAL